MRPFLDLWGRDFTLFLRGRSSAQVCLILMGAEYDNDSGNKYFTRS
jgi:hypothetical protein